MTALAEKIISDCFTLGDEEQLEIISRVAIENGWNELHEIVEDLIAAKIADSLENGTQNGMSKEDVFSKYEI